MNNASVGHTRNDGPLSPAERQRYARHLILRDVGVAGQLRLKQARVLLVGAGGLGSPCALYLAAAGVGTIGLVDHDRVDESNLQRQVIHGTKDVGRPKLDSATDRLRDLNPHVTVERHEDWLTSANAMPLIAGYDVIVDGTDNFATRYLVNDACVLTGKPNVHASVFQFDGQASVFATEQGPCYRCLYPEPPPPGMVQNCAEGGVLGVLPGLLGTIQAVETIKLILGLGDSLAGRLLMVDTLGMEFRTIQIDRDPGCPACGTRTLTELIDYDQFCGTAPVGTPVPTQTASAPGSDEVSVGEARRRLASSRPPLVLDVREPWELADGVIAGAINIPLGQLEARSSELDNTIELLVVCRSGKRSADAVSQLAARGFRNAHSIAGGMLAWANDPDEMGRT